MHQFLFLLGLYAAVIRPMEIGLLTFRDDREGNSLELIALTGLDWKEYFLSKLAGTIMVASGQLLVLYPLFAIPFLSGGLSFQLYLCTIASLPVFLVLAVSVAGLASAIAPDESTATLVAITLVGLLCLLVPIPYLLGKLLAGTSPFSSAWLALSPATPGWVVGTQFAYGNAADVWPALAMALIYAVICLVASGMILSRTWRAEPGARSRTGYSYWQTLRFGTEVWRRNLRAQFLEHNPLRWLGQRDRRHAVLAWFSIAIWAIIWMAGWCVWPVQWPSTANFITSYLVLYLIIHFLSVRCASHRLAEDRREGHLEYLLTTKLMAHEVVVDQLAAAQTQFRPIWRTVEAIGALMLIAGFFIRPWPGFAAASYCIIWSLMIWGLRMVRRKSLVKGMWVAVNLGQPSFFSFRRGGGWHLIWLTFNLRSVMRGFGSPNYQFPSGSDMEFFFICLGSLIGWILCFASRSHYEHFYSKLTIELPAVVQDPLPERDDPRLQTWDLQERLSKTEA